jgi:hypothetical protein
MTHDWPAGVCWSISELNPKVFTQNTQENEEKYI